MKDQIKKILEKLVGKDAPSFLVEVPADTNHGDYSSNVALVLAKKLGKNPRELASEIANKIGKKKFIEKIEVAGAGFINFYLSKDYFISELKKVNKNFGKNGALKGKRVMVEFTDPNPFKEFHIGHLMPNAIGESICRIIEFSGAKVRRANYQGDVGLHVAKAIWGNMNHIGASWQDSYVFGAKAYEENEEAKKEIIALNKKIFERSDLKINALYDQGRKESLDYFEAIYKKLGTKFDYYFFESQVAQAGKDLVTKNLGKIFEVGANGAIIFPGKKFGLHTRVFINSESLPTYEAKELALANIKYGKYKYDQSIIVTGNEINEYFKVLLCAMSQVYPKLAAKTLHIGHGMLRLSEGKMSSRTGNVVAFEFLLGEVEKLVEQKMEGRDLPESEKKKIIESVAIGALKYSILKQSIGSNIIYDFEKSISFEGDSGPYLQYAYARSQSILKKASAEKIKASYKKTPETISQLEKMILRFPETVTKASAELEPQVIALYLIELAQEFNTYYANNKIVNPLDIFSPYKVAITEAFSQVMRNGLWILGINVLEKM
jgi:arginyl-tRNA synthetase